MLVCHGKNKAKCFCILKTLNLILILPHRCPHIASCGKEVCRFPQGKGTFVPQGSWCQLFCLHRISRRVREREWGSNWIRILAQGGPPGIHPFFPFPTFQPPLPHPAPPIYPPSQPVPLPTTCVLTAAGCSSGPLGLPPSDSMMTTGSMLYMLPYSYLCQSNYCSVIT